MDKVQALCMCLLVSSVGAVEISEEEDALIDSHKDLLDVPKDIIGPPKDILEAPKDLLNDDLEEFAEHGGGSPPPSSAEEEGKDHQTSDDLIASFEGQSGQGDGGGGKDRETSHETSHDLIAGFDGQQSDHPRAEHHTSHQIIKEFDDKEGPSISQHIVKPDLQEVYRHAQLPVQLGPKLVRVPVQTSVHGSLGHVRKQPQERRVVRRPEYAYNYGVYDPDTRDVKSAWELRNGDRTRGGYSIVEPDGYTRVVEYTVSSRGGFNALVKRLPPH